MGTLDSTPGNTPARSIETNQVENDFKHSADVVVRAVEGNDRELFLSKYYREHPEDSDRGDYIRSVYEYFQGRLKLFADRIDDNSPAFEDLLFLQDSIQALFEAFYRKSLPLSSAFPDENTKKRFYEYIRRYVLDDHVSTLVELQAKYPKKPLSEADWTEALKNAGSMEESRVGPNATQDEVDKLLQPKK